MVGMVGSAIGYTAIAPDCADAKPAYDTYWRPRGRDIPELPRPSLADRLLLIKQRVLFPAADEPEELRVRYRRLGDLRGRLAAAQETLDSEVALAELLYNEIHGYMKGRHEYAAREVKACFEPLDKLIKKAKDINHFRDALTLTEQLFVDRHTLKHYRRSFERFKRKYDVVPPTSKRMQQKPYATYLVEFVKVADSLLNETEVDFEVDDELRIVEFEILDSLRCYVKRSRDRDGLELFRVLWAEYSRVMADV